MLLLLLLAITHALIRVSDSSTVFFPVAISYVAHLKLISNNNLILDGEDGAGEANIQNNGSSASNENPVSGSVAPQPVVPSAVGLVTGGASAAGHQPPYDLRRKSPHHDPAAAAVAPNYPSGCNPASGSLSSNSACAAGPSGYAACMLPARKRPRRTCYTSCESEWSTTNSSNVMKSQFLCRLFQVEVWLTNSEVQLTTSSMNYLMKFSYAYSVIYLRKICVGSVKSVNVFRV